jgi:circadian clock protein KaiC
MKFFSEKIIGGDFPEGSMILIAGEPGTGKTIFVSSLVNEKLSEGKKILFVSFNETEKEYFELMKNIGLKFDKENFKYIELFTAGKEVAKAQLGFIYEEIEDFHPDIIVIDSITSLLSVFGRENVRSFLHTSLGKFVKKVGATAFLIAEKPLESRGLGYGIEEFVVDGIIILKYEKHGEHYRRVMEIPKMRGRKIRKPSYEYAITDKGFVFFDIPELERTYREITFERVTTGIEKFDELVGGGFYRDSITLVIGNTGAGKTTFGIHFTYRNAENGKRALFVSFEENENAILRAMKSYGMDYESVKENLRIVSWIPEAQSPISYFVDLLEIIDKFKAEVIFIDSLSALKERMNDVELSKLMRYLQLMIKKNNITMVMTMNLDGELSRIPQTGVSTLSDNLILLWNEFEDGEIIRRLIVLKTRGSDHSRRIHRYEITKKGIVLV